MGTGAVLSFTRGDSGGGGLQTVLLEGRVCAAWEWQNQALSAAVEIRQGLKMISSPEGCFCSMRHERENGLKSFLGDQPSVKGTLMLPS